MLGPRSSVDTGGGDRKTKLTGPKPTVVFSKKFDVKVANNIAQKMTLRIIPVFGFASPSLMLVRATSFFVIFRGATNVSDPPLTPQWS